MSGARKEHKVAYFAKFKKLCQSYDRILLVTADNVGSKQIQDIRIALRGKAEMLMGKNTMIRKCLRGFLSENPKLEKLLPIIRGNLGFVFTNGTPKDIRDIIQENKVQAPARAGSVAQCDVHVPTGPTGLEPTQTSFFQALNIATKITRGAIEIINPVHLIVEGTKVGSSEALLLQKLNITPFYYGLITTHVYDDGSLYSASVLDITDEIMAEKFGNGVGNIAAVSLAIGFPTLAAMPHNIKNGYKNILCISIATDYTFPGSEKIKALLDDPEALAAAQAAAASNSGAASGGGAAAETKEEDKEESDDDMGFGLFD